VKQPTCKTCIHFETAEDNQKRRGLADALPLLDFGECHLNPSALKKKPHSWCSYHPHWEIYAAQYEPISFNVEVE
jgi:hypothetical protein